MGILSVVVMAVSTNVLPDVGVMKLLEIVLSILVYGLGVAAVLGVVIAGILYMTARDNEQQVATAKRRLYEIVIGLIAWALMFTLLNWLIPGGLNFGLGDSSEGDNASVSCSL